MSRYLTIIIFVYINTINIGFTFRLNHYHSYQLNKKNKKKEVFVSDDDDDDDDDKYEKDVQSSSTAIIVEDTTGTAAVIDEKELTLEQKTRKEKPSARVRFIESSQPDFVSIGLENVGLMYGNDVILKSATFSISSGMIIIIAIMMRLVLYILSYH